MKYNHILGSFVLMVCTIMCIACTDNNKKHITRLVSEWQGKKIVLPDSSIFTIQGKDTVDVDLDSNYKILVYVDSAGCTSCRLQLHKWKEFIEEVDSVATTPVQFLFYLTPKSVKEARYITRRDDFTYPMCVDINNEINKKNKFPEKDTFHTFLLDTENKVRIIGNPIHNNTVRDLYINAITR